MDKQLKRNIFSLLILQKANYILPFLIIPYLTRVLGPANFGKISFIQAVVTYFLLFTEYGFNMSASRQIAIHRNDQQKLNTIFWTTTYTKALLAGISLLILLSACASVKEMRSDTWLYLVTYSLVLQSLFSPIWFLQGMDKPALIIPITVLPKFASLLLIFFFVRRQDDYAEAMIIQFLVAFVLTAVICVVLFRRLKLVQYYHPNWREIRASLADGWHLFLSTAAISFYTTSNTVLLGIMTNNQVVGYFAAADKLVKGVQALIFTIGQASYPRMNKLVSESKEKAISFLVNCLKWMGGAGLICSAGLLIFAETAVHIVFGANNYKPAIEVVRILAISPFFVAISYVFGILGLLPFGYTRSYSRIYIITGLISLVINVPLTYFYNMYGVAVSVLITEMAVAAIMLRLLQKNGILVPQHLRLLLKNKN